MVLGSLFRFFSAAILAYFTAIYDFLVVLVVFLWFSSYSCLLSVDVSSRFWPSWALLPPGPSSPLTSVRRLLERFVGCLGVYLQHAATARDIIQVSEGLSLGGAWSHQLLKSFPSPWWLFGHSAGAPLAAAVQPRLTIALNALTYEGSIS